MSQLRVSKTLYEVAKAEAEQMHRKVGGQIEHWAKLGRLLERSVSHQNIRAFLSGATTIDEISALEHTFVVESIIDEVESFSRAGQLKELLKRQEAEATPP